MDGIQLRSNGRRKVKEKETRVEGVREWKKQKNRERPSRRWKEHPTKKREGVDKVRDQSVEKESEGITMRQWEVISESREGGRYTYIYIYI